MKEVAASIGVLEGREGVRKGPSAQKIVYIMKRELLGVGVVVIASLLWQLRYRSQCVCSC